MSCYIVNDHHIAYLVKAAQRYQILEPVSAPRMARRLHEVNVAAVAYCYGENDPMAQADAFVQPPARELPDVDAVQVIKACDCYRYQVCSMAAWERTEVSTFIAQLKAAAINRLPGYDAAQWEIRPIVCVA